MILENLEVIGFRGLVNESIPLKTLTIFTGEMGTGKTSKLLAILFGLTGSTISGLNLDDLINVESEFMWVRIQGNHESRTFSLERRKRRTQAVSTKADFPSLPRLNEKIFIEGREISKLFIGAPTEKVFKIDTLLGLSIYDQVISEISIATVERKIDTLASLKSDTQQYQLIIDKTSQAKEEISKLDERLHQIDQKLAADISLYRWAEETRRKADENERMLGEVQSRKSLLKDYEAQLASIPILPLKLEEEMKELEARYNALQKRVAFFEATMQILDLEGKRIEETTLCPLCGALISPKALERFKDYDDEYKRCIVWITDLEALLSEKRKTFEDTMKSKERREILQNQIVSLKDELRRITIDTIQNDEWEKADSILKTKVSLIQEKKDLETLIKSLEEQKEAYETTLTQLQKATVLDIDSKIQSLKNFGDKLRKIKVALIEAVNETRSSQLQNLRASFKEAFKKIYPYLRLTDVDFETVNIRGREILQVKAKTDGKWIYSHQMSTGENVALSFALLYAINHLEKSPILLLDEPEEGLDEKGVEGLADVLNSLKSLTQIIVATRSPHLAQILQTPSEPEITS